MQQCPNNFKNHKGTMNIRLRNFLATPLRPIVEKTPIFVKKPTKITKGGFNYHRSNRAKEGNVIITYILCNVILLYLFYIVHRSLSWSR